MTESTSRAKREKAKVYLGEEEANAIYQKHYSYITERACKVAYEIIQKLGMRDWFDDYKQDLLLHTWIMTPRWNEARGSYTKYVNVVMRSKRANIIRTHVRGMVMHTLTVGHSDAAEFADLEEADPSGLPTHDDVVRAVMEIPEKERNKGITFEYLNGRKMADIGREYGITRQCVQYTVRKVLTAALTHMGMSHLAKWRIR